MARFSLVLAMILANQACIDLEEDTSSVLKLENLSNEGEIVAALAPIYAAIREGYRHPHAGGVPTYGADDRTTWWAGNKSPLRVFDRFDYGSGENSDILWLPRAWDYYWQTIYYANTLIEGLKTSTAPEDVIKVADGEARFLRALAYFHLVRTFGNMPIILDGDTPTGDEERATVLQNYGHIEQDLLVAAANLPGPEAVSNFGRVSSAAANALLADFYLTWAGWPLKDNSKIALAAERAKMVIDLNYFILMPIDELWLLSSQNSLESVFSMQFSEVEDYRSGWPAGTSFHEARGWSDMYPELQFFYDFPEGPRKDFTFYTEIPQRGVSGGAIIILDPPTVPWQESQRQHPMYKKFALSENLTLGNRTAGFRAFEVIRYAEVLLNRAEALNEISGPNEESVNLINMVRTRAEVPNYSVSDFGTKDELRDAILDERGWEFVSEGLRRMDLIHQGKLISRAVERGAVNAKEYMTRFPIPQSEINSNPNLEQNPGY